MLLRSFAIVVGKGAILLRPSSCSVAVAAAAAFTASVPSSSRRHRLLSVLGPSLSSVAVTQRRYVVLCPLPTSSSSAAAPLLLLLLYPLPVARPHLPPIFVIGGSWQLLALGPSVSPSQGCPGDGRGKVRGREG